jgi:histidinol-phosphate/aromatic aminotransferase/cobyric acid decarboxylase-like protein
MLRTVATFVAGATVAVALERVLAALAQRRKRALLDLAPIVGKVAQSKTVAIFSKTSDMKARGEKVNSALCVGQPDFAPPPEALRATTDAVERGLTAYTAVSGTLELRQAICKYLREVKQLTYGVDQVLVSCGGKQAIYEVMLATCGAGDEVIVPAPYWTSYPDIVALAGATPVILPTAAADGYAPTAASLAALLRPSTRMVILCNPSNPSGAVIPPLELEALAAVLRRPEHAHVPLGLTRCARAHTFAHTTRTQSRTPSRTRRARDAHTTRTRRAHDAHTTRTFDGCPLRRGAL